MSQTVEQLQREIEKLKATQGNVIKTGVVKYIHLPESPTEKMKVISIGLDCSEVYNGRLIEDYIGFQVTTYNKDLFPKFDRSEGKEDVKVGDTIKVMLTVGSYAVTKKNNMDIIYNNCNCIKFQIIERGDSPEEAAKKEAEHKAANPQSEDEAPF